jgi:hypothetical protein
MAKPRIAKRKATKPTPQLVSVEVDETTQRVEFSPDGVSDLSNLLGIAAKLPMIRYDRKRLGGVLDVDAERKESLLFDLDKATFEITATIKLFGLLMAAQDEAAGLLDHQRCIELGYTLNGLADIAEQLMSVSGKIAEAAPSGDLEREVSNA